MAEDAQRPDEDDLDEDLEDSEAPSSSGAEAVAASSASEAGSDESGSAQRRSSQSAAHPSPRRSSRLWWALPILMLVEFYFYGHDGRLEVCVGVQDETDFSLVGQERTDENRWKFPRCETRLNLGLRTHEQEKTDEALKIACRGATIFRHQGEAKACVAGEKGWQHHVEGSFVPPWDPAYYEHLFWFLR